MIVNQGGRAVSIRTEEEELEALRQQVANLSEDERAAFLVLLDDLRGEQKGEDEMSLLQVMTEADYKNPIVDIETFVYDEYYLGNTCSTLYPKWLADLQEIFEGGHYEEVILTGAIGGGKCVDPDTEIYDPLLGRRRAGELGDNWAVTALEDDGEQTGKMGFFLASSHASGVKPCVKLTLRGGQHIVLSEDHPVRTNRGWVQAQDITLSDLVATPRSYDEPLQPLQVSDALVKFVAYLAADGGCTGPTTFINMAPELLDEFTETVVELGEPLSPGRPFVGVKKVKNREHNRATTLRASGVRHLVKRYGLDKLAKKKRIPSQFYLLPREQVALFVNRFWACDGYIRAEKPANAQMVLASEGLIDDLRFLLLRLGVHSRKSYAPKKFNGKSFPAWRLDVKGADNVKKFFDEVGEVLSKEEASRKALEYAEHTVSNTNVDVVPVVFEDVQQIRSELQAQGVRTDRKFREFCAPRGQRLSREKFAKLVATYPYRGGKAYLADSDIFWERVASVEPAGLREVVDLSVPHAHNFVGNNIVVHNSFCASIGICRMLYELSCLRDPHRSLGLATDSNISIVCLSGDTEIYDGVTGERATLRDRCGSSSVGVLGFKDGVLRSAASRGVVSTGVKPVFRIKTSTGRCIKATAEHQFLEKDLGAATVSQLRAGSVVALASRFPVSSPVDSSYSDDVLKVLGYLISEGSTRTKHVSFGITDELLLEDYVRSASALLPEGHSLTISEHTREGRKKYYIVRECAGRRGQKDVRYGLQDLCETHGLSGKLAYEKRIPSWVLQLPLPRLALFLNRLFAGDGGVHKHKRPDAQAHQKWQNYSFRYCSTSYDLARDVVFALARFGIFGTLKRVSPKGTRAREAFYVDFNRSEFISIFIRDIGIYGREVQYAGVTWRGHRFAVGDVCWDEVVSIEEVGPEETFCVLDVEGTPWYVADGFITHNCLSVNQELAMKVAFENVATKLKASPYFQENFAFKSTKKEFRFPHNIWLAARATTDTSALGLNVLGAFLDETEFMNKGRASVDPRFGSLDHAEVIYTGLIRRMKSRFGRLGRLPGKMFLVSSKGTREDFLSRRIRAAKDNPYVLVRDYPVWGTKPDDYHSSKTFPVLCGNEQLPSRILTEAEAAQLREAGVPDGATIVDVPDDFRPDFESNLEGSIKDIAGIAVVAVAPFIQRREKLIWDPSISHPFTVEVYDPSKPGEFIWQRMVQKIAVKDSQGYAHAELRPIVNPTAARHVHIDPAYRKDRVGFCMGHIADWRDVRRRSHDGTVYQERAPVYRIDVILQIIPPVGGEIILGDIRRLVYELSSHGYMIGGVTMDTWQSVDALQHLQRKGYQAEHLSVDTTVDPYEVTKAAFYEDRIVVYEYTPLFKELRALERVDRPGKGAKIDHPRKGHKDVADSLAGCVFALSREQSALPLPILPGMKYSPGEWDVTTERRTDRFYPDDPMGLPGMDDVLPPMLGGVVQDDWGWGR